MDMSPYYAMPGEKPLDVIKPDGGFTGIFRTIACVGDSLSSGAFESVDEQGKHGCHDYFEYSWGQYIARAAGCKVYNFSRGGMSASEYNASFARENGFWDADKACQAYILALGANDLTDMNQPIGSVSDVCLEDPEKNADTFCGHYAKIIQRYKAISPKARFFLMTMPREADDARGVDQRALREAHQKLLYDLAGLFEFTYVLDFFRYAPVYDQKFHDRFFLGGHMNAGGYLLTAQMTMSYIDFLIRHHPEDFAQAGFIGTDFHYAGAKW